MAIWVFLFLIIYSDVYAKSIPKIPSFLKICHRNDPYLNECVKASVESLRPYLKIGIPALNIPPCEPLLVPEVDIKQGAGLVAISSTYKNIRVLGGTNFVLRSLKIDLGKDKISMKLYIPRLEMSADYVLNGKILMLPIVGSGRAHGNYSDIDAIVKIQGERYKKPEDADNHTYLRVKDFYVDFDVGHASMHLDNLFNGDKSLAEAMNNFLNDNWKSVAAELKPTLEETISNLFKTFYNQIYAQYPVDTLLPP